MDLVDRHPQRQQIREDILAGMTLKVIAQGLKPSVHPATLSRYRMKLIGKAVNTMQGRSSKSLSILDVAGKGSERVDGVEHIKERKRVELQAATARAQERRERWISDAEKRAVLDKLGEPVRDSDGTVIRAMDHAALARHDRNFISSIDLEARIAGVLTTEATTKTTVQVCVMMPAPATMPEMGEVVDIGMVRSGE